MLKLTPFLLAAICCAQPVDPGVRGPFPGAGGHLPGLTATEAAEFEHGLVAFQELDNVDEGLGPRFNLDSCAGCHAFPSIGGTSPAINPQVALASKFGAKNIIPPFIRENGPIREIRFRRDREGQPDGGVHGLFTIRGRSDAPGCEVEQPDFSKPENLSFRIPTPTFGLGLIESIPDSALVRNLRADRAAKTALGINGHLNMSGNDGTAMRFGWKAQNKSLLIFAAEAYNVEQGITNFAFMTEREEDENCGYTTSPEDDDDDVPLFAAFMRFLAPPSPAMTAPNASVASGSRLFRTVGCALCHTPSLTTGNSFVEALRNKPVNLYSDLALHKMGSELEDGIVQGMAGPDEFRTAPLWGLGQRIFFLHDGRTTNLLEAIDAHSSRGSEANGVVRVFRGLSASEQQDVLNFLRSL